MNIGTKSTKVQNVVISRFNSILVTLDPDKKS